MEVFISIVVAAILAETSYLAYQQRRTTRSSHGAVLIDTSVLIDGRIVAIARSGLVSARLLVPQSVVRELQFMADRADHDKRERARYGLDVIEKLQQLPNLNVTILADGVTSEHGVDEQLIILAQRYEAKLCTIDYNLNKAARVQSVEVININELAHALRVNHLPGEQIDVELVQPGQDKKQAVGYLDDGTMVVVEDARDSLGKTIHVELTRVLQTAAGRMMFARKHGARPTPSTRTEPSEPKKPQPKTQQRRSNTTPPRESARPETATKPQSTARVRQSTPKRRQSPEDKLVNLANK